MMSEFSSALGLLAVLIAIVGYVPYLRNIFRGKTKPHAFSWLVWGVLNCIAFYAQVSDGAGAGAWVVGFTGVFTLGIFVLSLFKGEKDIKNFDWFSLLGATAALLLWVFTNDPLLSVILVTIIDVMGFLPTFRKTYLKPYEETLFTYVIGMLKYGISVFALANFSVITALFPVAMVIVHVLFVGMVVWRRKQA